MIALIMPTTEQKTKGSKYLEKCENFQFFKLNEVLSSEWHIICMLFDKRNKKMRLHDEKIAPENNRTQQ